jgi:ribosome-associated heat shock protein Hsp15
MCDQEPSTAQRIDQWLWFARIVKSRTLAQTLIASGKVRLNRTKIDKASATVKPGDVLTLLLGPRVRIVEILGIGKRRGPAPEAQRLFRDLTGPAPGSTKLGSSDETPVAPLSAVRPHGSGRPTKLERRQIAKLRGR